MGPDSTVNDFGGWRQIRLCVTKSEKTKSKNSGFPQFLKILSSDFHQIWTVAGAPQGGPLCKILEKVYFRKFFWGALPENRK